MPDESQTQETGPERPSERGTGPERPSERGTGPERPSERGTGPDWAVQAADRVEGLVASIRSKTSDRLVGVARLLVFGVLAAIMGVMALVLFTIASIRALDELIPRGVWLPYLILGAIFVALGLLLWARKKPHPTRA